MLLNTRLICTRRRELGLSQRAVARRLAVSLGIVSNLEAGTNHDDLPLSLVAKLADTLALDLSQLVAADGERTEQEDASVARLGALLAAVDEPVASSTLADVLELRPSAVGSLLDELDLALRAAGLRLHRGTNGAEIVGDRTVDDAPDLERALRAQQACHGIKANEAALLHLALIGELDSAMLGNAEQVAYARLINAGLMTPDGHCSDDVLDGLCEGTVKPSLAGDPHHGAN